MSSRTSRKSKNPRAKAPEPIITRTKSAQQRRQLRKKEEKKIEKPEVPKPDIKSFKPETKSSKPETKSPNPETKSLKPNKPVKRPQVSLLKPIKVPDEVLEQIEYYPNTLKREFRAKKIMLKPKHNFKVIAATNKRKMGTPQKGMKSPSSKNSPLSPKEARFSSRPCSSPELSMQDMVRMMEETRSLSDEDFMEILTCPSPVWWEDPPDEGIDEGTIHKRKSEPPPKKIRKETKKRKITTKTTTKRIKKNLIINLVEETEIPQEKTKNTDERFVKKKQKLENILGIIKNKATQPKKNGDKTTRNISESEVDFSDLSFNEEEILKNLENMDIPIEESLTASTDESLDETVAPKNYNGDRETPPTCIPVIKEVFSIKSSVFDSSDFKSDVSLEEMNFQSDTKSDEIVSLDRCTNSSLGNNEDSSSIIDLVDNNSNDMGNKSPIENNLNLDDIKNSAAIKNVDVPIKKIKVLSEYINVYKITPEKQKSENNQDIDSKPAENTAMKLEAVRGKLNDFFKHCKSNKRLKKTENAVPANPVTDVKEGPIDKEKENGDSKIDLDEEKSRLKSCDYCVQKTENGTKDFSCEKCEMAPILPCGLCNFVADTKEVYKNHVSSCKDVARISWSHNYVLNQT